MESVAFIATDLAMCRRIALDERGKWQALLVFLIRVNPRRVVKINRAILVLICSKQNGD